METPQAAGELLPLVYEELRKLAAAKMANEAAGHTLQPTALVHEAWLRLAGNDASVPFANRAHFFAVAGEAMRRILIDRARRKSSHKRGRDAQRLDLDKLELAAEADSDLLLLVNESLERLEKEDPTAAATSPPRSKTMAQTRRSLSTRPARAVSIGWFTRNAAINNKRERIFSSPQRRLADRSPPSVLVAGWKNCVG